VALELNLPSFVCANIFFCWHCREPLDSWNSEVGGLIPRLYFVLRNYDV
jgi:hypothetical protein